MATGNSIEREEEADHDQVGTGIAEWRSLSLSEVLSFSLSDSEANVRN
jgi:hypothetical protein